ncbi:MAG: hypothetical protein BroJett030_25920 [Alphaproteobacteria bacterium]|nr:MAG: hypothetical protein BroJett030_25920 [Alphaproteobacteria bacterium]
MTIETAIAAATSTGRVRFAHPAPSEWWHECVAAADAAAERLAAAEPAPAQSIIEAAEALRRLVDVLAREVAPGRSVLEHIAAHAPSDAFAEALIRVGRLALPDLAVAAAQAGRHAAKLQRLAGPQPSPTRALVQHLAELFAEGFTDADGERAKASHGDVGGKKSPFLRWLAAVVEAHAAGWKARYGFETPIKLTPKLVRLALASRDDGYGWTGDHGP